MKKLYEKNELAFAITWIVIYCVLQSFANPLNKRIGIEYSASALFCVPQSLILLFFIRKNKLSKRYGLCKSSVPARRFLYYAPLAVLATGNLWNGISAAYPLTDIVCHILFMLCVGFVEEVIFRGFLFKAIEKDNAKSAIIISSVTFGMGHFINLFNGSGMDFIANLCQICFAVAAGFLFVTIFYRGGSLFPCIITHAAINMLSIFANKAGVTVEKKILHVLVMIVLTVSYTFILTKLLPKHQISFSLPSLIAILNDFRYFFYQHIFTFVLNTATLGKTRNFYDGSFQRRLLL